MPGNPGNTDATRPASVLVHPGRTCGCRTPPGTGTVDRMNSATASASLALLRRLVPRPAAAPRTLVATLAPTDPVQPLDCAPGCRATLQVLAGLAWVTQHGDEDDWFLQAGQRLALPGPGRLYVGAEGSAPLRLRWVVEPAPPRDGTAGSVRGVA